METKIIKIDQDNLDHKLMQEAGDLIAAGEHFRQRQCMDSAVML
mgnify:CR=1 FL=1